MIIIHIIFSDFCNYILLASSNSRVPKWHFLGALQNMHKLTFFPLGNADCCRIDLEGGQEILFDYADTRADDNTDLRIDLPGELKQDLRIKKVLEVPSRCLMVQVNLYQ